MSKKTDFTQKVKRLVRTNNSPDSLEDFLNDEPNLSISSTVHTHSSYGDKLYKREEFKFPIEICEKLRTSSYALKRTKKEIVQTALTEYLSKLNF